jgi:glycosyltransferase involved in cell wall biosynthesis
MISLDKGIFREGSRSLERLREYSIIADKIFVVVWTRKKDQPISFNDKLFVFPTNSCCRPTYYFDSLKIVRKILKQNKIDLISSQDPFEAGLAGWFISWFYKITFQLQVHTDFLSPYFRKESLLNKIRVMLAKFLIPRANCLRVVSERIRRSFLKELVVGEREKVRPRIIVLPIFVNVKKIQEASVKTDLHKKYPQFDFIILMASRLTKEKNIGLAIESMAEITKKYPKTGLIVAGEGPEKENLKSQISNLKINENIKIEEWTNDLISYYKTADLFLLTSNYEGYGMAVVEAMAAGCSVIMTDVGLAGEVLIDKKDGIVVPVGNKEELIESILNLIENPDLRAELIKNASKTLDFWPSREKYLMAYRDSWLLCK